MDGKADLVFDKLTERMKQIAEIDWSDPGTTAVLNTFGEDNPRRFELRYLDKSEAKILLGQGMFGKAGAYPGSAYLPGIHYVVFTLGYAQDTMPEETIAAKVAELVREAEAVCKEVDAGCVIRHRPAGPTKY